MFLNTNTKICRKRWFLYSITLSDVYCYNQRTTKSILNKYELKPNQIKHLYWKANCMEIDYWKLYAYRHIEKRWLTYGGNNFL